MRYSILILFFWGIKLFSQNVIIKGQAHRSHIGSEIILSDYADYVTYTKTKESFDTIDKNGYFQLKIQTDCTKPVNISIGNLVGKLYIQPNFVYGIYFPSADSTFNYQEGAESKAIISVFGKDSTELNALVIDFNNQYNSYFAKATERYLSPSKINSLLDSFLVYSKQRYKHINEPYFKNYLEYTFANLYANTSRSKAFLQKQFIDKKPILYSNYEYMDFFNTHYKGYLKSLASTKVGGSIYTSINELADYTNLWQQVSTDKSFTNDTLKELVILKGLIDCYFSPDFDKTQVQSVIEQLHSNTPYPENKKIAFNLLQSIYQLQVGSTAPNFIALNKKNETKQLADFKTGKYIYLNFFSTKSDNSLKEMQKLIDVKKKFNDKVTFISICLDDSSTYHHYLKTNPKQDWHVLNQHSNSNAKQLYNVKTLSGYFFINPKGEFALSPALSPSEGIEYKFYALFRNKKKNTIIGVR